MAQSSSAAQIAERYVSALIDTAANAGSLDAVEKDMADFGRMIESSEDLKKLLSSPSFSPDIQANALKIVAEQAGFQKASVNLILTLAKNGRLNIVADILKTFDRMMSDRRGQMNVKVSSATPLNDDQIGDLRHRLATALQSDVQLDIAVDAALIGGLVITIGSRQIDDSIKTKLEKLRQTLITSNQNNLSKEAG